jgi:hypothetical protein
MQSFTGIRQGELGKQGGGGGFGEILASLGIAAGSIFGGGSDKKPKPAD